MTSAVLVPQSDSCTQNSLSSGSTLSLRRDAAILCAQQRICSCLCERRSRDGPSSAPATGLLPRNPRAHSVRSKGSRRGFVFLWASKNRDSVCSVAFYRRQPPRLSLRMQALHRAALLINCGLLRPGVRRGKAGTQQPLLAGRKAISQPPARSAETSRIAARACSNSF